MDKEIDLVAIKKKIAISQFARQELGCKVTSNKTMCCHLHKENSPSLHFNDERRFYYCFGCHKSGDVFSLIQEIKNCSFFEAVKLAAEYAGIVIADSYNHLRESPEAKEKRDLLYAIIEDICIYFEQELLEVEWNNGLKYLYSRKLNKEIIKKFRLGYCSDNIDRLVEILKEKYDENYQLILDSGIIRKNSYAFYCILNNRIIFPIFDKFNRVIAFGGRVINDQNKRAPKYINAADSPLFKKSEVLYGENFALPNIKKNNEAIIVEGYFDVIALHSIGIDWAMASLGTAISEFQLNHLWNLINIVKCALDGDSAGYRAMIATIKKALPIIHAGKFLCFANLSKGADPASLIFEDNESDLLEYLKKVSYPAEIIWKIIWLRYKNISADFIAAIRQELNEYIDLIKDNILKTEYKNFFNKKINDITGNVGEQSLDIRKLYAAKEQKSSNPLIYNANNISHIRPFFNSQYQIKSIYEDIFCHIITLLVNFPNLRANILESNIVENIYKKSFYRLDLKEMLQYVINQNFSLDGIIDKFSDFRDSFKKAQEKIDNILNRKEEDLWLHDVVYRLELISLKEQRKTLEISLLNNNKDYYDVDQLQKIIFRERELLRIINNDVR